MLSDFLKLDWLDIVLHVLAAALAVGVVSRLGIMSPAVACLVNAAVWFVREGVQQYRKDKPLNPVGWSLQKHVEWLAPAATGPVFFLLY